MCTGGVINTQILITILSYIVNHLLNGCMLHIAAKFKETLQFGSLVNVNIK